MSMRLSNREQVFVLSDYNQENNIVLIMLTYETWTFVRIHQQSNKYFHSNANVFLGRYLKFYATTTLCTY